MHTLNEKLSPLYEQLSRCADLLDECEFAIQQTDNSVASVTCAVLSEDVRDLLDECEERLLKDEETLCVEAFEARALTIIDEVLQFALQVPRRIAPLAAFRHSRPREQHCS